MTSDKKQNAYSKNNKAYHRVHYTMLINLHHNKFTWNFTIKNKQFSQKDSY